MTDTALDNRLLAAKRLLAIKEAQESMTAFMRLMMPDPEAPDDPSRTLYDDTPQGRLLCRIIEDTLAGRRKRTGVSIPPQHGKTVHLSTMGLAWIVGKDPKARIILATYNEIRAGELGEELITVLNSPAYRQVFPHVELRPGSKSKTAMRTTSGAYIVFTGQGGTITGRTAKYFIIDDPIKDDEEVQNDSFREKLWKWFYSVAYSRGGNQTRMIVLHTRWHEDDLLGRLCDKEHPERNSLYKGIADDWEYLNIPGVITDPEMAVRLGLELEVQTDPRVTEQFGFAPMAALYAKEKNLQFFAQWRRGQPRTFDALVMGRPSPDDGVYFLAEWLVEYEHDELPPMSEMKFYGASDHAVSEKQGRDYTVLGCVGIDRDDNIWVLPDIVWERMETDRTVDEMIEQFRSVHRPQIWWMEDELISKSFGPFLKVRMREERVYVTLSPTRPAKDKSTRARAIQGRCAMKNVRFPRSAPWWPRAKAQLLRFPHAANDDFVDWLAHIGQGLLQLYGPGVAAPANDNEAAPPGTLRWILRQTEMRATQDKRRAANEGW